MAADDEQLRRAMLEQINKKIVEAATRELGSQQPPHRKKKRSPPAAGRSRPRGSGDGGQADRTWEKPKRARLVLERLGEVIASGRRSLYGTRCVAAASVCSCLWLLRNTEGVVTRIDSPAALFAAMGGGSPAVGLAQFCRALRRLDVAASEEAVLATVEMLDPGRSYFRAFDGPEFVRIVTPFCITKPLPPPPGASPQRPSVQACGCSVTWMLSAQRC